MTINQIDLGLGNFKKYSEVDFDDIFGDVNSEADYLEMSLNDFESFNQYEEIKELFEAMLSDNDNPNWSNVGCLKTAFGKPVATYVATLKLVDNKPAVVIGSYEGDKNNNPSNVIFVTSQLKKKGKGEAYFVGSANLSFGLKDGQVIKSIAIQSDGDYISLDLRILWNKEIEKDKNQINRIDSLETLTSCLSSGGGGLSLSLGDICNEDLFKAGLVKLPLSLEVKSWDAPFFPQADDKGNIPSWSSINIELLTPALNGIFKGEIVTNIAKVKFFNNSQGGRVIDVVERIKAAMFLSYGGRVIIQASTLAKPNFVKDSNGEMIFKNYSTPQHSLFMSRPKEPAVRKYFEKVYQGLDDLLQNKQFKDLLYTDYTLAYTEFLKRFPVPLGGSIRPVSGILPEASNQVVPTKQMRKVEPLPVDYEDEDEENEVLAF